MVFIVFFLAGLECELRAHAQTAPEVLTVAVPRDFPPQYLTSKSGVPSGFAIDIMDRVAAVAGVELRYEVFDTWAEVFSEVINGRADVIPNIGITPSRASFLDFTPPVETFSIRIFVRKDTMGIHELADLAGLTVGVMSTNIGFRILSERPDVELSFALDQAGLIFKLLAGHVDAIVYPAPVIMHVARAMDVDRQIKAVGAPVLEIKRAIGVGRGKDVLLEKLSRAVKEIVVSEEYKNIYVKWYGRPKEFWSGPRMAAVMGGVLFAALFLAGMWRYALLKKTNMLLSRAMAERVRAELALGESEKQFRSLVENINEGIWQVNGEGVLTYVNPCLCEMLGYAEEEMVGRRLSDFMRKQAFELVKEKLEQRKLGMSDQYDLELLTWDGSRINTRVTGSPLYDAEGVYMGALAGVMDVTLSRIALEELEKSQRSLAEAQAMAGLGSWECDIATGDLVWSDELYGIFGFERSNFEPTYHAFFACIHPDDRAAVAEAVMNTTENLVPYSVDHRIVLPDGGERTLLEQGRAVCEEGKSVRLIGTALDITERKRIELELRAAMDRAESANRVKDEFLANMSHEIRTPLNGVLGMLQLLQETNMNDEQSELADIAIVSGRHLVTLLSDILDISSIEAGSVELKPSSFDVRETLHTVEEIYQDTVKKKSIAFRCEVDAAVPERLVGDVGRLRQVLFNLVGNAVKFTETGEISVEVALLSGRDSLSRRLFIEVSDTGIGIPHDKLDSIFVPFTQVDGSHTRRYGGTGLGLSIVSKLVLLMGGHLTMDSLEGSGTTVGFTAKVELVTSKEASHGLEYINGIRPAYRVLLAEDDRINRITATRFLQKLGHDVVAVENGWLAVEALRHGDFDLVLMDIQMPEMNGLEATVAIRQNIELGGKARVPIVALTAHVMEGDRDRCFAAGMNDYLSKPVEVPALAAMLERNLSCIEC
ncbi:MAG: transporter substrate-binding domain-containing protein [Pseudodesulfovibrio sp.]|nr:transporter substrate-binding domain-containing protein [Pseudodesulfovibrio sp.]